MSVIPVFASYYMTLFFQKETIFNPKLFKQNKTCTFIHINEGCSFLEKDAMNNSIPFDGKYVSLFQIEAEAILCFF